MFTITELNWRKKDVLKWKFWNGKGSEALFIYLQNSLKMSNIRCLLIAILKPHLKQRLKYALVLGCGAPSLRTKGTMQHRSCVMKNNDLFLMRMIKRCKRRIYDICSPETNKHVTRRQTMRQIRSVIEGYSVTTCNLNNFLWNTIWTIKFPTENRHPTKHPQH